MGQGGAGSCLHTNRHKAASATVAGEAPKFFKEVRSMSKVGKEALINALELRFDFQSARNVFKKAVKDANLKDQSDYSSQEIAAMVAVLVNEDRMESVHERFSALAGGRTAAKAAAPAAKAPEPARTKAPEPVEAPEPPKAEAPTEEPAVAPEPVVEAPAPETAEGGDDEGGDDDGDGDDESKGGSRRRRRTRKKASSASAEPGSGD